MRLRVFSEMFGSGRCWMYVVFEPGRPAGIHVAGVRPSWAEALHDGRAMLRRLIETDNRPRGSA